MGLEDAKFSTYSLHSFSCHVVSFAVWLCGWYWCIAKVESWQILLSVWSLALLSYSDLQHCRGWWISDKILFSPNRWGTMKVSTPFWGLFLSLIAFFSEHLPAKTGKGFQRNNLWCTRSLLELGLFSKIFAGQNYFYSHRNIKFVRFSLWLRLPRIVFQYGSNFVILYEVKIGLVSLGMFVGILRMAKAVPFCEWQRSNSWAHIDLNI